MLEEFWRVDRSSFIISLFMPFFWVQNTCVGFLGLWWALAWSAPGLLSGDTTGFLTHFVFSIVLQVMAALPTLPSQEEFCDGFRRNEMIGRYWIFKIWYDTNRTKRCAIESMRWASVFCPQHVFIAWNLHRVLILFHPQAVLTRPCRLCLQVASTFLSDDELFVELHLPGRKAGVV